VPLFDRHAFASFRELDRRIWWLALGRCINTMGFSLVLPFMAMYLVEERGTRAATYGVIYLVAGIVAAGSQALSGELSDRFGRRTVMLSALVARTLCMVALGWAVTTEVPLGALTALIIANSFFRAQFEPAASAAVTDLAPPERRVAAFGLQRMGVNLGWAVGPALGGFLAATGSYGALFFFAAPATLVAIFTVWRVPSRRVQAAAPPPGPPLSLREVGRVLAENRRFLVYLGLVFLGTLMTVQLFTTLSVFAKVELGLGKGEVGLLYTVNGVMVLLLQIPAVAIIERGGPRRALVLGPAIYAIAYLAIGGSETFVALALAVALLTAGEVIFAPALSDMAAYLGDPRRMGRAFGLFGLMQSLGVSVGPLVGGLAFDHLRHDHLLLWGAIAGGMAIVGVGFASFARRYRI
jgi:predicted MFS family arabinose efflux permease